MRESRPVFSERPLPHGANSAAESEKVSSPLRANKDELSPTRAPELTASALIAGCVLGAALASANVYTALKTGYIDGGSITASVLSFAAFRMLARSYSALENNITQTVAASAAVMSLVAGVAGPIPALERAGYVLPSWVVVLWSLALAVLGIAIAVVLRARLITAEGLPFPTGTATAEVIAAMSESGLHALRRARGLLIAAAMAACIAWLRDGPLGLLPQALEFGGTIAGLSATTLSLGITVSPLMIATGLITGLRAAGSMLVGGAIAWIGLASWLVRSDVVPSADHEELMRWLLWPGVALVLSGSFTALALQWRSLARGLVDVRLLAVARNTPRNDNADHARSWLPFALLVLISVAVVVVLAQRWFGLSPWTSVLALLVSSALAAVCARGAGETDIAPCGDMGGLTQLMFGSPSNTAASLSCGAMATASSTQTAQTLWALKAGQRLGADHRSQMLAQLLGAIVGGLVVVPTYRVVVNAYGLGSAKLPAISVLSWQATAAAVQGGLAALPRYASSAALVALLVGSMLTLLGRSRYAPYVPSPAALGIGFLMPLSMSTTFTLGALALTFLTWRFPAWTREHIESVAGGAIAGESLFAVLLAALVALGVVSI